jgi:histidine triad (HIT) family protein
MDCLFCKIAAGEIPSKKVYEDEKVLAFYDIEPQAPVHFLVIPKTHITGADKIAPENEAIVGHIFSAIAKTAKELGLENGFRVVNNCGKDAMQSVEHLHFHVLAGRQLGWPPG